MSFHENSFGSKKKLRQLSITDLFQPAQKKRCASNKSDQTSSDDIKMENRAGDGPQKVSSEQKCSEASNISQEFSSEEKTQQSNDHIERPQVKVDADANDKFVYLFRLHIALWKLVIKLLIAALHNIAH